MSGAIQLRQFSHSLSPNRYIPFVASGGIEFGVANLQEVDYALEGKEWCEGKASP
jgi:uncharacterized protein